MSEKKTCPMCKGRKAILQEFCPRCGNEITFGRHNKGDCNDALASKSSWPFRDYTPPPKDAKLFECPGCEGTGEVDA